MHSDYVPLHLHTHYSLLDGAIRIDELIAKAEEHKLPAIAITDHGNIFGAIEFYKKVSRSGMKPIIGCEVYIAPQSRFDKKGAEHSTEASFHLILLCKDLNGYKNLSRLVSKAYLEGFYYRPRIDKDLLSQYSGGLIGLSSCLKGEIPHYLAAGMIEKARESALNYKRILGADNFFLEIQANELPEQEKVNKQLIELSRDLHIGLVATNDCHYLRRDDAKAHDILICIQTGKTLKDTDRMKFSSDNFYFKSPAEMKKLFIDVPEAIENTKKIAERCNLDFKFGIHHLPKCDVPAGYNANSYLEKLAAEGLEIKFRKNVPENYRERLLSELRMIEKTGFSSYFLIVWDFIRYAKDKGIPVGPGRGSAAGSLVAYCLDITEIDPIKYGLLFERFLNPDRISMPDIDVDFCMNRRSEVIEYVARRYGEDHVAQIITFGTMQARAAIRDVGRAMDIPYAEVDRVAKLIPAVPNITLKDALNMEPMLKESCSANPAIRELIEVAQRLEGLSRHASTHAAGVVISPVPLTEFLPLYKAPNETVITTQYDMGAIETLGLLKFDFLGLKTLTVIDRTEKLINRPLQQKGSDSPAAFSIKDIPLDDKETFKILCDGRTTGIFQLESSGMRDLIVRLRPEAFEDMIALVALYRPGPLGSGMVDDFIKRKRGEIPIKFELPQLAEILRETYGGILYQEQVMQIANKLSNFSMAQADTLRKAMGKKQISEMEKMKDDFIHGAKANKISEKKAIKLFDDMAHFAQYGFNKSHSAAYALIAYRTAYLKAHYPVEFMAASLSSDMDNTAKVVTFINECREMAIEILPPDINQSAREFQVIGHSIRFGLEAVKGVGSAAIETILELRRDKEFTTFFDFCARVDTRRVNKKVIESLIKAGALDSMGKRAQVMLALNAAMDAGAKAQKERDSGQKSMFESDSAVFETLPEAAEWDEGERLSMEKEALGFYITGHPLNRYKDQLEEFSVIPTHQLQDCSDREDVIIGGIVRASKQIQTKNKGELMAYITVEDLYGTAEIIVFPDLYREAVNILSQESPVIISGQIDKNDKGSKIIAKKIALIQDGKQILEHRAQNQGSKFKARKSRFSDAPPSGRIRPEANQETGSKFRIQKFRSLTLTLDAGTDADHLLRLQDIITQYHDDNSVPVYLKIISPDQWETLIVTNKHVSPGQEIILEVENILGEGTAVLN
ncbi:MAG: DNA polymerase III subunit alpha [Nitrospirae bacterium]|nr:DNA polymerase III subunit alpha [Nitrospirota bacterium]